MEDSVRLDYVALDSQLPMAGNIDSCPEREIILVDGVQVLYLVSPTLLHQYERRNYYTLCYVAKAVAGFSHEVDSQLRQIFGLTE